MLLSSGSAATAVAVAVAVDRRDKNEATSSSRGTLITDPIKPPAAFTAPPSLAGVAPDALLSPPLPPSRGVGLGAGGGGIATASRHCAAADAASGRRVPLPLLLACRASARASTGSRSFALGVRPPASRARARAAAAPRRALRRGDGTTAGGALVTDVAVPVAAARNAARAVEEPRAAMALLDREAGLPRVLALPLPGVACSVARASNGEPHTLPDTTRYHTTRHGTALHARTGVRHMLPHAFLDVRQGWVAGRAQTPAATTPQVIASWCAATRCVVWPSHAAPHGGAWPAGRMHAARTGCGRASVVPTWLESGVCERACGEPSTPIRRGPTTPPRGAYQPTTRACTV